MKVKIEFEIELPDIEHTEDELEEFVRYTYGDNGSMKTDNPFNVARTDTDPIFGTFEWEYL